MAELSQPEEARFLAKKKNRKLSWVGVDEDTPYSYLRESMVSSLMGGICDPTSVAADLNPKWVSRRTSNALKAITNRSQESSNRTRAKRSSCESNWCVVFFCT